MSSRTIWLLLKREWIEQRLAIIWLLIFTTLILCAVAINQVYTFYTNNLYGVALNSGQSLLQFIFISMSIYMAGFAFWEFKSVTKTRYYLLIPATHLEKVVSKIIVYTFLWWLAFLSCWIIAVIIADFIYSLNYGQITLVAIMPLLANVIKIFVPLFYSVILLQGLAIFASCYFKKLALFKLTVAIILLLLLLGLLLVSESLFVYKGIRVFDFGVMIFTRLLHNHFYHDTLIILPFIKWGGVVVIWCLTWLRLKETEAI